ncbi:hypothetical protein RRF57_007468 [Xylaria bambusicola]|uniref:Uncharacterized protein n=1 Tax=Xylaria bambusicola TaxID=326684 RepID=A0AAN7UV72_9PEZI
MDEWPDSGQINKKPWTYGLDYVDASTQTRRVAVWSVETSIGLDGSHVYIWRELGESRRQRR